MVLAWSPDGKQLLCGWAGTEGAMRQTIRNTIPGVADRVGLKIIDIESGEERHLPGSFHGFKAWSADGKYIASADADNNLCIFPVDGGLPRTLVYGDIPYWWPQWSEDPERLYFKQPWPGGKLCSISIDASDPVPTELMECPGRFAVCETGDWVAYEESSGVSMLDLSSGSLLYRCPSPWPLNGWGLRPSPSGRELFFASWWSYINAGPIVLDTKEKQLYHVLDYPVDQLLWSPDGSRLAIGAAREIWIMDLDPNVPISQTLGQKIPGNDLARYWLQRHTQAIAAAPSHPENYLERALARMSLDEYQEAEADLRQFDTLVTSDDHHVGGELFWWLRQCYFNRMYREAELLTPHAERVMERFPIDVPSYQDLIEQIVEQTENEGKTELSRRWRAKLNDPTDRGK
jgi:WD40 repeat protein